MSELESVIPQEPPPQEPPIEPTPPVAETAPPEEHEPADPKTAAIIALRKEVQELKPLAQKAQQFQQYEPYLEFVKSNWDKLQAPAAPPPAPPSEDPELEQYARRFDLYTADGKPDIARAKAIQEDNRKIARAEAEAAVAPVQERSDMAQAAANLQWMQAQTDANGTKLEQAYIDQTVQLITKGMPKAQAIRTLADPNVARVVAMTALGLQASQKKSGAAPPPNTPPPLHIESPGGQRPPSMTESERKLAKMVGRSEKDWVATNARFKPGQSNALED